jgi:mono/diheme cytochrome c family protein
MKYLVALPACAVIALSLALPREAEQQTPARPDPVARGKYLVSAMACADCHTPWVVDETGPHPDETRAFSGHPADLVMPPAPELPEGPWQMVVAATNTAWAGPWGVSFTANLTADPETGLGPWSEDDFIQTLRNVRHRGRGRELLPPLPAWAIGQLSDDDLRAVFAYLQSLPPIHNRVPEPIPPGM